VFGQKFSGDSHWMFYVSNETSCTTEYKHVTKTFFSLLICQTKLSSALLNISLFYSFQDGSYGLMLMKYSKGAHVTDE
jgi:hypothetical protein